MNPAIAVATVQKIAKVASRKTVSQGREIGYPICNVNRVSLSKWPAKEMRTLRDVPTCVRDPQDIHAANTLSYTSTKRGIILGQAYFCSTLDRPLLPISSRSLRFPKSSRIFSAKSPASPGSASSPSWPSPFTVICNNDDLTHSSLNHLPNNFCLSVGWNSTTMFQADPIHTDNNLVCIYLFQVFNSKSSS